jgi:hypothetical protein
MLAEEGIMEIQLPGYRPNPNAGQTVDVIETSRTASISVSITFKAPFSVTCPQHRKIRTGN